MQFTLRPVRKSDRPFEVRLMRTGWEIVYDYMDLPEEEKMKIVAQQVELQERAYRAEYPNAKWLIIVHEGMPIGRYVYDSSADAVYFIDIAILPAYRNQGLGMEVIRPQLDEIAAGKTAYLHVMKGNSRPHRLYDRMGFVICGESPSHFRMMLTPEAYTPIIRS